MPNSKINDVHIININSILTCYADLFFYLFPQVLNFSVQLTNFLVLG